MNKKVFTDSNMNEENNDRKETIIIYAIVIITLIIAVWIGFTLDIRIKTLFWGLVIIEMLIYTASNAVMEKLRGGKSQPDNVPVNLEEIFTYGR